MDEDSVDAQADAAPGAPNAYATSVTRRVLPILVLLFALGNAFLALEPIAKTCSLPPMSAPAAGQWRRGAALVGAVEWIVLPLIAFAAYGLPGAALAAVGYLTAAVIIAAVIKPTVIRYAAEHLVDGLRDLRLRAIGVSRGSRLIVDGYRRLARHQGLAPTAKTTDAEIRYRGSAPSHSRPAAPSRWATVLDPERSES